MVGEDQSSKNNSALIDASHPYFLASSDSPGMTLITTIFDGTNFGNWRHCVLISLSTKNKLVFINRTCILTKEDSTLLVQWTRCNDMVLAWLLNSFSKEITASVIYSQIAAELWNEQEKRYKQADGTKLF